MKRSTIIHRDFTSHHGGRHLGNLTVQRRQSLPNLFVFLATCLLCYASMALFAMLRPMPLPEAETQPIQKPAVQAIHAPVVQAPGPRDNDVEWKAWDEYPSN